MGKSRETYFSILGRGRRDFTPKVSRSLIIDVSQKTRRTYSVTLACTWYNFFFNLVRIKILFRMIDLIVIGLTICISQLNRLWLSGSVSSKGRKTQLTNNVSFCPSNEALFCLYQQVLVLFAGLIWKSTIFVIFTDE